MKARLEGGQMKALAWFGAEDVLMIEAPILDVVDDEDVVLKVTGTTICGSDLHLYHGEIMTMQKGDIPGHECMGVIDRIEKSVTKLSVGDRVVTSFQVACGKCVYCKKILSSFCEKTNDSMFVGDQCQRLKIPDRIARLMGFRRRCMGSGTRDSSVTLISPAATLVDRPNMFELSGFGLFLIRIGSPVAHGACCFLLGSFGDVNCLKLPAEIPDKAALDLPDILLTAYHCVVDTGVEQGDVVEIWVLVPPACLRRGGASPGEPSASSASRAYLAGSRWPRSDWASRLLKSRSKPTL
ncbi:hypothetical protein FRB96_000775 [Tulasnella sp. 330]|nr:hypothetical protein FRB96_000775 [Tulasnella sp. 330]KAG8888869.1 hypothetical protein FRB98_006655 [Tulasnella sp. 332]